MSLYIPENARALIPIYQLVKIWSVFKMNVNLFSSFSSLLQKNNNKKKKHLTEFLNNTVFQNWTCVLFSVLMPKHIVQFYRL